MFSPPNFECIRIFSVFYCVLQFSYRVLRCGEYVECQKIRAEFRNIQTHRLSDMPRKCCWRGLHHFEGAGLHNVNESAASRLLSHSPSGKDRRKVNTPECEAADWADEGSAFASPPFNDQIN